MSVRHESVLGVCVMCDLGVLSLWFHDDFTVSPLSALS